MHVCLNHRNVMTRSRHNQTLTIASIVAPIPVLNSNIAAAFCLKVTIWKRVPCKLGLHMHTRKTSNRIQVGAYGVAEVMDVKTTYRLEQSRKVAKIIGLTIGKMQGTLQKLRVHNE